MSNYALDGGNRSPFCWGKWDEKEKKFLNTNSADVINCCINFCKNPIEDCYKLCSKKYSQDYDQHYRCNKQCLNLVNICGSGCMEIEPDGLKIASKCAKEKGCGSYPVFSQECLKNKKEDIKNTKIFFL